MKEIKFDGSRWWLKAHEEWIPFLDSSFVKLALMVGAPPIVINKIYQIDAPEIYAQNHDVNCTGLWRDKGHYECAGTGLIATFEIKHENRSNNT